MALTYARASEVATYGKNLSDEAKVIFARIQDFLTTNADLAIGWTDDPLPTYLNEDVDGNLDGFKFTREQMSNAIFSLDQMRATLDNEVVTQGDHMGNLNQLADAEVTT